MTIQSVAVTARRFSWPVRPSLYGSAGDHKMIRLQVAIRTFELPVAVCHGQATMTSKTCTIWLKLVANAGKYFPSGRSGENH